MSKCQNGLCLTDKELQKLLMYTVSYLNGSNHEPN